ncbi:RNA polymerase sigma factor (sigma-70 family) [Dyadobacter jejuensis]|uniref:RNA polymerase sigma factor (Sigma-70 family) n=1 Tax=Dyadobacter jejuensis TaxID=1082580 RepID=A0A316AJF9_9BACT|nr:sigma-70 family RNA polymerase sigma factor [Dyadobacter jejuensis]PWJ57751.1 RNA polymerase sigma factor (sigma-70 family) [Dyadobacter jejuensis]
MQYFLNEKAVSDQDQALWSSIIDDDKSALSAIFDIYAKELITYGYGITGNLELIEDAIQDVFVDVWQYRKNLSRKVQVKFYLYSCLRRAIMKQMPHRGTVQTEASEMEWLMNPQDSIEQQWVSTETEQQQKRSISESLNTLSDREREVVTLKYYSNMKIREIALLLDLKDQTIANTLQNALTKLRKNLVYMFLMLQVMFEKIL